MHGSIQSAGTDDVSSTLQMKLFNVAVANMRHTQMVLRVHVPEQIVDISLFHGADLPSARRAMTEEINDRLGALLKVPVTPQSIRRSSLPNSLDVFIFLADVTIINQAAGTNVNFQRAMQGLTKSGGSLRTLTDEMVDKWETLATASAANQSGLGSTAHVIHSGAQGQYAHGKHRAQFRAYTSAAIPRSPGAVR